jgi:drug/metabolite transporter (DMT)-like permease
MEPALMIQSVHRTAPSGTMGMVAAAAIWGTWVLILSLVSLPGIYVTPTAYFTSSLGLLILILVTRNLPLFLRGLRDTTFMRQVALAALLEAIQFTMFIVAFSLAIASGSSVVIPIIRSLSGVVTPLLAVISFAERFSWRYLLSGLLACAGSIIIFTRGGILLGENLSHVALLLALVSVIMRGLYYLKQREVAQEMQLREYPPVHVLTYHTSIAALILLPVVLGYRLIDPQPTFNILLPQLLFIGIFGITHGAFGALLRLRSMRFLNAQQTIIIMYIEPVTSVTLSILFLGESVSVGFFAGAALVLLATTVASLRPAHQGEG